jgi:hypothetical protein
MDKNKFIDEIVMENNNSFDCMVILPGSIEKVSWLQSTYSFELMKLDLFEMVPTNKDNFMEVLATKLDVDKYKIQDMNVKTSIVAEEYSYVYQLMYIDMEKNAEYMIKENLNEMASLINTNGDKIYSNAILFKNYLPSLSDSMSLVSITKKDVGDFLHNRVYTRIVTWDDSWDEKVVMGDLNIFAHDFFDDNNIIKIEFPFLMHNINIWYTTFSYGRDVCGKLLNKKIDKCIWFTMKSDEIRGSINYDEVKKIIYLSEKLDKYITPSYMTEEKFDSMGRKIIYNKYKVLDYMYNNYK